MELIDLVHEPAPEKPKEKKNYQLFENNTESQKLAEMYVNLPEALHNAKTPNLVIQHEDAWHRLVLVMTLQGLSNREIARRLDRTEPWISQVKRQPWFQKRLTEELANATEEVVDSIVKVEATNSIFKLVQLRDHAESETVQMNSAIEILNRHLGKTIQRTENKTSVFHVSAKLDDLDKQITEVEGELTRLQSGTTPEPSRTNNEPGSNPAETKEAGVAEATDGAS